MNYFELMAADRRVNDRPRRSLEEVMKRAAIEGLTTSIEVRPQTPGVGDWPVMTFRVAREDPEAESVVQLCREYLYETVTERRPAWLMENVIIEFVQKTRKEENENDSIY